MPELSEKVYPDGTVVKLRDDTAREQIAELNAEIGVIDTALAKKTEYYRSPSNDTSQTFNIGVETPATNRCYLFSAGYVGRSTLEFIAIASDGRISNVSLVNNNLIITAISFDKTTGVVTITLSNNPYCQGRLTKLC